MRSKPEFRQYDSEPYRTDDIRVKAFGVEVEANGRIVVAILVALALVLVAGYSYVRAIDQIADHDKRTGADHVELIDAVRTQICVSLLDPDEKKMFRLYGSYCSGTKTAAKVQEQFK